MQRATGNNIVRVGFDGVACKSVSVLFEPGQPSLVANLQINH